MASNTPEQIRVVDPFSSFNSDTVNQLTRMITQGVNGLTTVSGLDVIEDSTSPTTTVVVTPGSAYMDDVLITITEDYLVDFTDSNNYIAFGSGFDEDGWYQLLLEYSYARSRPAPVARVKILKPSQVPSSSLGSSLLFLKAVYVTGGGPHYIDTSTNFRNYDPSAITNKREYTDLYFGVETFLPLFNSETDRGRVVYESSTDSFWFGYSSRWGKISAGVEINIDTTGTNVGDLCYTDSNGNAALAIATDSNTGAEMVVAEVGTAAAGTGRALMSGAVDDVPVETGIVINVGDLLYLSNTEAGTVTSVKTVPARQVVGRALTGGNSTLPIDILFFPRDVLSIALMGTINPGDWVGPNGDGLYFESINITALDIDSTHPTAIVNIWDDADDKKISPVELELIAAGNGLIVYSTSNTFTWNYIISTGGGSVGSTGGGGGGTTDHDLLLNLDYASANHTGFAPSLHGNADHSSAFITSTGVTKANLDVNGDVGTGAAQVSQGDHTHAGLVDIPSGQIILFESDVAVSGYSLLAGVDDQLVYISSGGVPGLKPTSTWSQPNHGHPFTSGGHTHTFAGSSHNHKWFTYGGTGDNDKSYNSGGGLSALARNHNHGPAHAKLVTAADDDVNGQKDFWTANTTPPGGSTGSSPDSGTTNGNATPSSWRPLGRNFTRQQRS